MLTTVQVNGNIDLGRNDNENHKGIKERKRNDTRGAWKMENDALKALQR